MKHNGVKQYALIFITIEYQQNHNYLHGVSPCNQHFYVGLYGKHLSFLPINRSNDCIHIFHCIYSDKKKRFKKLVFQLNIVLSDGLLSLFIYRLGDLIIVILAPMM